MIFHIDFPLIDISHRFFHIDFFLLNKTPPFRLTFRKGGSFFRAAVMTDCCDIKML